jgi:3-methyladenine DNA glycosylase/8-oxoguanine DNA glycosylase
MSAATSSAWETWRGRFSLETEERLEALAERWRPWRALAVTHLWLADGQRRPLESSEEAA